MSYVLIVDDDEDFASAAAIVLRNSGFEVDIELNIVSAEKSMHTRQPDLVILDVLFPENSDAGFSLARIMRKEGSLLQKIPIIMLTAVNAEYPLGFSSNDIDEVWMPVDDFMDKPVDLDVVCCKVSRILSSKAQV